MSDSTVIAAIGLGNIIQNSAIEPIFASLNSGLEILVSQAVGARNFPLCGQYLNRGTLSIIFVFSLLALLLAQSKTIL